MPKIRTVFQPNRVIEVSDTEYQDLERQGAVKAVIVPKTTEPEADSTPVPTKKK